MKIVSSLLATALLLLPAAASARTVRLTTPDKVSISAELEGKGVKGVVLIHGSGQDHTVWNELSSTLASHEMQVLSVDLRGHGSSKGEADPLKMEQDVEAAAAYLRAHGAKEVVLVGASMGANLAFLTAAHDKDVSRVVMLSPALNHKGIKASTALKDYGTRPILMIAGADDSSGINASNMLADRMEEAQVEVLKEAGIGAKLLNRDPALEEIIVTWITTPAPGSPEAQSQKVSAGAASTVETTGVKLGEKR